MPAAVPPPALSIRARQAAAHPSVKTSFQSPLVCTDGSSGYHTRLPSILPPSSTTPVSPRPPHIDGFRIQSARYRARRFAVPVPPGQRFSRVSSRLFRLGSGIRTGPAAHPHTQVASRDCSAIARGPAFSVSGWLMRRSVSEVANIPPGPQHISHSLEQLSLLSRPPAPREPLTVWAHHPASFPRTH
jgi:hypothetical protein